MKEFFDTLELKGEVVLLGNNKAFKVQGYKLYKILLQYIYIYILFGFVIVRYY